MLKRFLGYYAILFLIIIWSFYFKSYELLFLSVFVLLLPIVNVFVINYSIKRINVKHYIKSSIMNKGEYIPIEIVINNKGILPVAILDLEFKCNNLYQNVSKNINFAVPVLKYGKQEYVFYIKSDHCGDVEIILENIKCMDYFELYYVRKSIKKGEKIYILPQIGAVEDISINTKTNVDIDGEKFSEVKPGDDPSQVFDFREYHPGDKLHSIHWKLSARRGNYMVKDYSLPLNGNYCILMDLGCKIDSNRCNIIDAITETAFTITLRLQEEGINHYFIGRERYGDACYKDIIEYDLSLTDTMFELYKGMYKSNSDLLDILCNMENNNNESRVYYITSNINEKSIIKLSEIFIKDYIDIIFIGDISRFNEKYMSLAQSYDYNVDFISIDNSYEDIAQLEL